jgi:hypothetical protein
MLNFYYAVAARSGLNPLKQGLQIPQSFTADRRRLRYLNLAGRRIEHPFGQLLQAYALILLNAAS